MLVDSQVKALNILNDELDEQLLKYAEQTDQFEWDTDEVHVELSASKRRNPNVREIGLILGPELMQQYGNLTLGVIDKLLAGDKLTKAQKTAIKNNIGVKWGEPSSKVTPLSAIDE
jgi:hypothetical protein